MKADRSISLIDHMLLFFFLYNLMTLGVQKGRVVLVQDTLSVAPETIASQWLSSDHAPQYKVPFIFVFKFCPYFFLTALSFHLLLVHTDLPCLSFPTLLPLGSTILLWKQQELQCLTCLGGKRVVMMTMTMTTMMTTNRYPF